jgi:two-component system LytT family sensor kinase
MTVPMLMLPHPIARSRFSDWPFAIKSILGFWLFYALTVVVRAFLTSDPWTMVENKLLYIAIGIGITGLIYLVLGALGAGTSIRRKVVIAAICATIGSVVMGASRARGLAP